MDAGNLLKPMLGRGELRCIGATTLDEYRKYIEKDPALERRFRFMWINQRYPIPFPYSEVVRCSSPRYIYWKACGKKKNMHTHTHTQTQTQTHRHTHTHIHTHTPIMTIENPSFLKNNSCKNPLLCFCCVLKHCFCSPSCTHSAMAWRASSMLALYTPK